VVPGGALYQRRGRGSILRKHLSKRVVLIVALVFASWFLLWPDGKAPVAPPQQAPTPISPPAGSP